MLSGVQLVRRGLADKLATQGRVDASTLASMGTGSPTSAAGGAVDGGQGQGMGGVVVKELVLRCTMTEPQAKVYSTIAR